jgi:hypothetical protein
MALCAAFRPEVVIPTGVSHTITVAPSDSGADAFSMTGQPYATVFVRLPTQAALDGHGGQVVVNQFTADTLDPAGLVTFGPTGQASFSRGNPERSGLHRAGPL